MPRKLKLDIEFTPEFSLTGVVCAQKDYRLCWLINKQLDTDLKRLQDFIFRPDNTSNPGRFSVFHHNLPQLMKRYFLVSNKSNENTLLGDHRNLDYLFLIKNPGDDVLTRNISKELRSIPAVEAALNLDITGKKTGLFLYDFEIYLGKALR